VGGNPPFCVDYNTTGDLSLATCAGPEGIAFNPSSGFFTGPAGGFFRREIIITGEGGGAYAISSEVSWQEGSEQKSVLLEDVFYPWRPI